jgi:hypothetical protein
MYDAMEEIVDEAEMAFTGQRRPTTREYQELEKTVITLTASLQEHPEWHDGPCACVECRSDS